MPTLTLHNSIEEIDPKEWDAVAGDNAVARSHGFLLAVEKSNLNDCKYFYPVIRDSNNKVLAHTCVYTISTDFIMLMPKFLQKLFLPIRKIFKKFLMVKMTECGTPVAAGIGHTVSLSKKLDTKTKNKIFELFSQCILNIAKQQKSQFIAVRDFLEEERQEFDDFLKVGFVLMPSLPAARIHIQWDSMEDFFSNMRSHYRNSLKKKIKKADNIEIKKIENFSEFSKILEKQVNVVYDAADDYKREILNQDFYKNCDSYLDKNCYILAAMEDNKILAHSLMYKDNLNTVFAYYGREANATNFEYFKMMSEIVKSGIDNNSKIINLGMTTYDAKSIYGAKVEPMYVYFKHRNPIIRFSMKKLFKAPEIKQEKRVFKS